MDAYLSKWILEFLLRQPLSEKLINGVLSSLPLKHDDNHLKRTLLLRKIEFEVSNSAISEQLLDHLETLEELYHREGKSASDSMKSAYCAVAVECTVRFLDWNVENNAEYFEAVSRIWRERVCKVEGLASEESKQKTLDLEAAVWYSKACEKLLRLNSRYEALKRVRVFLEEEWRDLGPTFLELVAGKAGDAVEELRRGGDGGGGVVGPLVPCSEGHDNGVRRQHIAEQRKCGTGATIPDADKGNGDEPLDKMNNTPAPQVDTVPAPIETGLEEAELQASKEVVRPNVPQTAETLAMPTDDINTNIPKLQVRRRKRVAAKRKHGRGAKISDVDEVDEDNPTTGKTDDAAWAPEVPQTSETLPTPTTGNIKAIGKTYVRKVKLPKTHETPEVERVQVSLRSSYIDLRASVKDPLLEALQTAEALRSTMATNNNRRDEPPVVNQTGLRASTSACADNDKENSEKESTGPRASPKAHADNDDQEGAPKEQGRGRRLRSANKRNLMNPNADDDQESAPKEQDRGRRLRNAPKRSLMDPDANAQTLQWTDSVDNLPERPKKRRLPRALEEPEPFPVKMEGKRERRRWTPEEEQALRTGVGTFGKGHWKLILLSYRDIFWGRSEVDLKDKWRNLTKPNKRG